MGDRPPDSVRDARAQPILSIPDRHVEQETLGHVLASREIPRVFGDGNPIRLLEPFNR